MQEIEEFPTKWLGIFHATAYWDYTNSPMCQVDFDTSFALLYHECENGLNARDLSEFKSLEETIIADADRLDAVVPFYLYEWRDDLLCQFKPDGHWFHFTDSHMNSSRCSSCDAKTYTSFKLREYLGLHDFVWAGLTDHDRELLGLTDVVNSHGTYDSFKRGVSKTRLKKQLFRGK